MSVQRLLSEPRDVQMIAAGRGVQARAYLNRKYGHGRWRKMKGVARVELATGEVCTGEVHWFEAHGVGRVEWKLKRRLAD